MRRLLPCPAFLAIAFLASDSAVAGAVVDQFRGGVFGLPWSAGQRRNRGKVSGRTLGSG